MSASSSPPAADLRRRVVVTGLGVVSSIGIGVPEFTEGLREGRNGASPITAFDTTGYEHTNGCEVIGFEPESMVHTLGDQLGRAGIFAAAAARMAMNDAGLTEGELQRQRGHITIGTSDAETRDLDALAGQDLAGGPESMDPALASRLSADRLATAIARELGLSDVETATLVTACSAGNYAIGNGLDAIRAGEADFAICGGADAVCRKTFNIFYRLGTIAPDFCRPFDKNRQGILTGEGAGILLLESAESALRRGARIYAEVLGYGLNCDGYHPVAPDQASLTNCMQLALDDAGVDPREVDLISAHGTGTKTNDVTEVAAIKEIWGENSPRTVSLKSMIGHTMGAASALAAVASTLAITHGFIPPTINHVETDPECDIDCVPNQSVPADLRIVQSNGLAFGGNNSVIVLGRFQESTA